MEEKVLPEWENKKGTMPVNRLLLRVSVFSLLPGRMQVFCNVAGSIFEAGRKGDKNYEL